MKLLVVEDERELCECIAEDLELEAYAVDRCYDGLDACERMSVEDYDLVILDLNLPGMDGLEVLQKIRSIKPDLRVLILSARAAVQDKVLGLDLGANDYLAKPFELEELEARVRSLLRRDFTQRENTVRCGAMELDSLRREIRVRGVCLPLTRKEFAILEHLILHRGEVVSQEELIEHVWNEEVNPFSHSIRIHISSLRKKLRQVLREDPIVTKIGQGYYLEEKDI